MATVNVAGDLSWLSTLAFAVDRAGAVLKPRVNRAIERSTGAIMVGLGVRLGSEAR
jgi:threonine/homoserine/homoserine lactone efflux protein